MYIVIHNLACAYIHTCRCAESTARPRGDISTLGRDFEAFCGQYIIVHNMYTYMYMYVYMLFGQTRDSICSKVVKLDQ